MTSPVGLSYPKKQSVDYKGGGLGGAPQCRRGGSIDREGRDTDARQRIVGPWAWQRHGTVEAGLSWSHGRFRPSPVAVGRSRSISTVTGRCRAVTIDFDRRRPLSGGHGRFGPSAVDFERYQLREKEEEEEKGESGDPTVLLSRSRSVAHGRFLLLMWAFSLHGEKE
ncbi:hypothetical protein B296_00038651 [Ensete ventricosum]|uniref:Uncharacterized protein n=1 Tax=Ensete ventricosum TaxID=4639 RepID=A0A426XYR0_ENSVE|nr:hypothetical protein B296_00038651 [Ensete ventricosum]